MTKYKSYGRLSIPMAHIQLRMVTLIGHTSHQDGVTHCPQLMNQHLRKRSGYSNLFSMIVEKTIGCLRPFQNDIRTMLAMKREKTTVEPQTFPLEHTYRYLYSCVTKFLNTTSLHFGKRIHTANDHPAHLLAYNQIGTWRRLSVMRTRFEIYIKCG